jgi:hypothetical protein
MFNDGSGVSRDLMADVLQRYVQAKGTITPTHQRPHQRAPVEIARNLPVDEAMSAA